MNKINKKFTLTLQQKHYLELTFAALLFTFGMQSFITVTETFSAGLGAIASLITYIVPALTTYFSFIYLTINIPGMLFSFKYNRKKFTYRTFYFLVAQSIMGIPFLIWDLHELIALHFWNIHAEAGMTALETLRLENTWALIMLPTIGAILVGSATAIAWRSGGSTAGIDVVTYYLSTKKKMSIGKVTKLLALLIVTFSFSMKMGMVETSRDTAFPTLIGTLLFIYFNTLMIDKIFPKYSKVEFNVFADNLDDIRKALKEDDKYRHSYNIIDVETGMGVKRKLLTSTVLLLEVNHLRGLVISVDENAWIKTAPVNRIFGRYNTDVVEETA